MQPRRTLQTGLTDPPCTRTKTEASAEIAEQVKKYLAAGGRISICIHRTTDEAIELLRRPPQISTRYEYAYQQRGEVITERKRLSKLKNQKNDGNQPKGEI